MAARVARRNSSGSPIADRDSCLYRFAKALVGISVDPCPVWVVGCSLLRDRAPDLPIDAETRQQRRDQNLPGLMIGRGEQVARIGHAVR